MVATANLVNTYGAPRTGLRDRLDFPLHCSVVLCLLLELLLVVAGDAVLVLCAGLAFVHGDVADDAPL